MGTRKIIYGVCRSRSVKKMVSASARRKPGFFYSQLEPLLDLKRKALPEGRAFLAETKAIQPLSLRRTIPASPTSPVPSRVMEVGSGTAADPPPRMSASELGVMYLILPSTTNMA